MGKVNVMYHGTGTLVNRIKGHVDKARDKITKKMFAAYRRAINASHLSANAKRRYREALIPYRSPRVGIYLTDKVAILLEKGWKKFDMKPGLLHGLLKNRIPITDRDIRTVSVNSPAGSWIHPGFKGANIQPKIKEKTKSIVESVLSKVVSE